MYIYPSSPESQSFLQTEESAAAIKIQAGFRGYRVRKQIYRLKKANGAHNTHKSTVRRQQQQRTDFMEGKTKQAAAKIADGKQTKTSVISSATADAATSVEDRSATKIQAGFRGFLVRKQQKIATNAAVKIQSSFRGFKARKEAEKLKQPSY
ncbi:abnormal spindle-like microcephaly-associated protein homolog [Drosophila grimshawi]|uniref:GH18060 n=1 Tax=Drosophila grimshawi TaxID=7222 RepID=B4JHM3_DROGR|nr:abnormal spindle-like microcephaly-associated protein homolog [Drosophila grimshawi]EDV93862.1 GH18060 [Drosophila grimshawi]